MSIGTPKKMKNIMMSSGIARNTSTTMPLITLNHLRSESRPTAKIMPNASDKTIATAAACRVIRSPGRMY